MEFVTEREYFKNICFLMLEQISQYNKQFRTQCNNAKNLLHIMTYSQKEQSCLFPVQSLLCCHFVAVPYFWTAGQTDFPSWHCYHQWSAVSTETRCVCKTPFPPPPWYPTSLDQGQCHKKGQQSCHLKELDWRIMHTNT